MNLQETDTEQLILNAARKVFFSKGFDGARMQEIANEAGINKALLHYYFRSKDKLFEAIFFNAFQQFIPRIMENMKADISFEAKIESFVENYINILISIPQLPSFVLTEVNRNPERIAEMLGKMGVMPSYILEMIQQEVDKGNIRAVNPKHLLANIIALCVFPFAARPLFQIVLYGNEAEKYDAFLEERKKEVSRFIIQSIKK
jgi:TetR/AcrR family transcriptional regulator